MIALIMMLHLLSGVPEVGPIFLFENMEDCEALAKVFIYAETKKGTDPKDFSSKCYETVKAN